MRRESVDNTHFPPTSEAKSYPNRKADHTRINRNIEQGTLKTNPRELARKTTGNTLNGSLEEEANDLMRTGTRSAKFAPTALSRD